MKKAKVKLGVQKLDSHEVMVRDSCFHEVEEYIAMNLGRPERISTKALAERFNYSPSQFTRRFVAVSGEGVKEYITRVKLEKAKEMLCTVNVSITEISHELGYASPFYFTNVFSKNVGISPSAFRGKFSDLMR